MVLIVRDDDGTGWVEIDFHQPGLRGRGLFVISEISAPPVALFVLKIVAAGSAWNGFPTNVYGP